MRRARQFAESRSLGLGRALTELIACGLERHPVSLPPAPLAGAGALQPITLPRDSPRVTTRRVRELENDPE